MTIVLLGEAPRILSEDAEEVIDADILDKHLPSLRELEIPFLVPEGAKRTFALDPDHLVQESSPQDIAQTITGADRVLVF